ncbi:MAG: hypothetical protein ACQEP8_05510 [Chlamydiota bacterium]
MMNFFCWLLVLPLFLNPVSQSTTIDDWMTKVDQKRTGIEKLSDSEKKALVQWLETNFTKEVLEQGDAFLSIEDIDNDGQFILLSDDSKWMIREEDRQVSQWWKPGQRVKFFSSEDRQYPIIMVLQATDENLHVRLSSKPLSLKEGDGSNAAAIKANHWIEQLDPYGRTVVLEDGSIWDVAPQGQRTASGWLIGDNIRVYDDKDHTTFPYVLQNSNTGQVVRAYRRQNHPSEPSTSQGSH